MRPRSQRNGVRAAQDIFIHPDGKRIVGLVIENQLPSYRRKTIGRASCALCRVYWRAEAVSRVEA